MPLTLNIVKAKDIHRDNIRKVRKPLLEDLDIQFMKTLENGSPQDASAISALKQSLRDEPANPNIEAANTIDDIKNQWNEGLLGNSPYSS